MPKGPSAASAQAQKHQKDQNLAPAGQTKCRSLQIHKQMLNMLRFCRRQGKLSDEAYKLYKNSKKQMKLVSYVIIIYFQLDLTYQI